MARKHRKFRGLTTLSFGMLPSLPSSASTKGLGMGAGLAIAAGLAARYLENTYVPKMYPSWTQDSANPANSVKYFVHQNLPGLAGIVAGLAAYFIQKKRGKGGGGDLLLGAGLAGAALVALPLAQSVAGPKFRGLTTLNFGGYGGIFVPISDGQTSRYNGIIVPAGDRPGTQGGGNVNSAIRGYVNAKTMANTSQLGALSAARMRNR